MQPRSLVWPARDGLRCLPGGLLNNRYALTIRGRATSPQGAVEGFGGRGGFGRRPALIVVDMTLGCTDPESPLGSALDSPIEAIRKLLRAERRAEIPVIFTTVAYCESDKITAAAFIDKVPALLILWRPGAAGRRSPQESRPARPRSRCWMSYRSSASS
jgi:hypothetical protein